MIIKNQAFSGWARFLVGSVIVGAFCYFVSRHLHTLELWQVATTVFLIAMPITLTGVYVGTLQRVHDNTLIKRNSWLYRLRSKRLFLTVGWLLWSIATVFFMLIHLNLYARQEWVVFFLVFPVFYICFIAIRHILSSNANALHVDRISIQWARRTVPWLMVVLYGAIVWQSDTAQTTSSLKEIIEGHRTHLQESKGSALIGESLLIFSAITGVQDYVLGNLGAWSSVFGRVVTILASLVISYNVCLLLSFFVIPGKELRRIFGPMSDNPEPPTVTMQQVISFAAITTFLFLFVYLRGFVAIETMIRQSPEWAQERHRIEAHLYVFADEIDGSYYRPETILKIEAARARALSMQEGAVRILDGKIDAAFLAMEGNVDPYLDWYYSLKAEYMRTVQALTGGIEEHMTRQLDEFLQRNDPFREVSASMNGLLETNKQALVKFLTERDQILRDNQIDAKGKPIKVLHRLSKAELELLPSHSMVSSIETRMAGAAVTSAVTGIVTAKVVGKVVGKSIFKLAATAATKLAVSKTGGAAIGAAAGAVAGSVIPGAGTAIGAVIGASVGVLFGVGMDATLLKLEEMVKREEFRNEILGSIRAAKVEFKKELHRN